MTAAISHCRRAAPLAAHVRPDGDSPRPVCGGRSLKTALRFFFCKTHGVVGYTLCVAWVVWSVSNRFEQAESPVIYSTGQRGSVSTRGQTHGCSAYSSVHA